MNVQRQAGAETHHEGRVVAVLSHKLDCVASGGAFLEQSHILSWPRREDNKIKNQHHAHYTYFDYLTRSIRTLLPTGQFGFKIHKIKPQTPHQRQDYIKERKMGVQPSRRRGHVLTLV